MIIQSPAGSQSKRRWTDQDRGCVWRLFIDETNYSYEIDESECSVFYRAFPEVSVIAVISYKIVNKAEIVRVFWSQVMRSGCVGHVAIVGIRMRPCMHLLMFIVMGYRLVAYCQYNYREVEIESPSEINTVNDKCQSSRAQSNPSLGARRY